MEKQLYLMIQIQSKKILLLKSFIAVIRFLYLNYVIIFHLFSRPLALLKDIAPTMTTSFISAILE